VHGKGYDIRSTYASYYVMGGGSIMRLKEILGHEDLQTTMIYATLSPENLHKDKDVVSF
jgi:site-specific recombinase XerD